MNETAIQHLNLARATVLNANSISARSVRGTFQAHLHNGGVLVEQDRDLFEAFERLTQAGYDYLDELAGETFSVDGTQPLEAAKTRFEAEFNSVSGIIAEARPSAMARNLGLS